MFDEPTFTVISADSAPFSIIANIAICSFALAYCLPKVQYFFRGKVSNNTVAPGLKDYYEQEKAALALKG